MSNVEKGNRLQALARRMLEADGYVVHTAIRTPIKRGPIWISRDNDVWNAFDLLATRMKGPRPLRFVQVTTAKNASERIKKVDVVPIPVLLAEEIAFEVGTFDGEWQKVPGRRYNPSEVWAWHGGRKRIDKRYKDRKVWLPAQFFQIYFKEKGWQPDPVDRRYADPEMQESVSPEPLELPPR